MPTLLLLEDDQSLIDGLEYALRKDGFALTTVRTVAGAKVALARAPSFELLILDVSLPDGTGFEVCQTVRAAGSTVPILFLTAADEEYSIMRGLDLGGDDYLTKPFKLGELSARLRALLRRAAGAKTNQKQAGMLRSGGLCIDLVRSSVQMDGAPLELTVAEYRLLCLLVQNAGCTLLRGAILDSLWDGNGAFVDDNTLSVYIRRLREKLERDPSRPEHLLTIRGFGYQWKEDAP